MGAIVPISHSVRCVLFDGVGTLIYPDPPAQRAYAEVARDFGLVVDEATVGARFASVIANLHSPTSGDDATSEDDERRRWRNIVSAVFPELSGVEGIFSRLWEHFAQAASWRLFDDVADCWRQLSDRGLPLGIASNFDSRLDGIVRGLPALAGCERVFVSSRIGWRKPALRFFRSIERELGREPHELLLVGDDWESDYRGAEAAGWQAAFLDRIGSGKVPTAIRSLAELSSTGAD